jgi:hypothetical protein
MGDLILNWIVQQLRKDTCTLQELGQYVCKNSNEKKKKRSFRDEF